MYHNIVTMLGPDPIQAIEELLNKGYRYIISFEKDFETYKKQLRVIKNKPYRNKIWIIHDYYKKIPGLKNVYYDFDGCVSMKKIENVVKELKGESCCFTVAVGRIITKIKSIETFFGYMSEDIGEIHTYEKNKNYRIVTKKGVEFEILVYKPYKEACMMMLASR